ncbi:Na+/H+ antiporter subunit D [Rhizobium sp. No.120]
MAGSTDTAIDLSHALVTTPIPVAHWLVISPVALCIGLGAILLMLRNRTQWHAAIAIPGLVLLVLIDAALLYRVVGDGPMTMIMGRWLPPFGIAFTVDILGALMALTAAAVALAASFYSLGEITGSSRRYGFFPFLMLLLAGVSGAFLTGDVFNLYVWFEVLLISSFGLLILGSEREQIDGALKYAVLNLIATTLFLVSVGYLYAVFGTLNMADIAMKARAGDSNTPLMTIGGLFLLAFGMKAAAFPVNFWLPASYHTPRITVSALFAGLLTKVGIYALIRVLVMLLPVERAGLGPLVTIIAIVTMLVGVMGALGANDIRRTLGYIVISGIGTMLAGVALGSIEGLSGAIFYALHSMVLMTALYLVAGQAAHLGGGFSLTVLAGLYRQSGWFSGLSLVLFFAISGLPPFSGFWPKVVLVKAAFAAGAWWLAATILLAGFLTTIVFGRIFLLAYWRPAAEADEAAAERMKWHAALPLLALSLLVVGFGLFPERLLHLTHAAALGLQQPTAYLQSVFPAAGGAQ